MLRKVGLLLGLILVWGGFGLAQADELKKGHLIIGAISNNVSKKTSSYSPLASYLSRKLASYGVASVQVLVKTTSEEMVQALALGHVHLVFDSPMVTEKIAGQVSSKPILRRWKSGVAEYHSVLIVKADSPVKSLEDLVGKRVAFQGRDSSSGFMLPASTLLSAGLGVAEQARPQTPINPNVVNYYFTGHDRHSITWLRKGWVEAVGTDSLTFAKLDAAQPDTYRVIAKSITVPRQVVLQSDRVSEELSQAVQKILIAMENDLEGKKILSDFTGTTRFDGFPDGVEETFKPIRERVEILAKHSLF